jgi:hypothetical protein
MLRAQHRIEKVDQAGDGERQPDPEFKSHIFSQPRM